MQTHIIVNGVVINSIVASIAEAQSAHPNAICIDGDMGGIGWLWDGTSLSAPPAGEQPVPEVVTPRQAKIALLQAGLLDDVEAGIEALEDQALKRLAQIEWKDAQEVRRDWPLLNQLAPGMGITDGQLDELFRVAAGI